MENVNTKPQSSRLLFRTLVQADPQTVDFHADPFHQPATVECQEFCSTFVAFQSKGSSMKRGGDPLRLLTAGSESARGCSALHVSRLISTCAMLFPYKFGLMPLQTLRRHPHECGFVSSTFGRRPQG